MATPDPERPPPQEGEVPEKPVGPFSSRIRWVTIAMVAVVVLAAIWVLVTMVLG